MNHFALQQNNLVACEERRSTSSPSRDGNIPVVCPKPRRPVQLISADPISPIKVVNFSHQMERRESPGGGDVLVMLLTQDFSVDNDLQWEDSHEMSSSPPFFYGSPPSRTSNPIIHDDRFLEEKANPPLTPSSFMSPSSPSGGRSGDFFRTTTSFGLLPAAVRTEGFDCLDRDRRGCSITAFA